MLAQTRAMAREAREVSIPSSDVGISQHTVVALAGIEMRRILLHPAFLGAMGLFGALIFMLVGGGGMFAGDGSRTGGGPNFHPEFL